MCCYFKHLVLPVSIVNYLTIYIACCVVLSCLPLCVLVLRYALNDDEDQWKTSLQGGGSGASSKHPPSIVSVARSKKVERNATAAVTKRPRQQQAGKTKKHKLKRLKKS